MNAIKYQEMEFDSITILLLFFVSANLIVAQVVGGGSFLECLNSQFQILNLTSDVIYTPKNSSYSSILGPQNHRPPSTSRYWPVAIITATSELEIQAAIHCSKKHGGLQMRVRSGGHDYEGLSYISQTEPFFIVDMRNLRSISILDTPDGSPSAWIEAGATLGELYYSIAEKNRSLGFPAGVCPTVGVGGHFSGGGYGMISRRYGIAVDYIIDARVMNADGKILGRESMGEDLFWAIRGGGGTSFGIVLAFKVNLVTVPETVTVFNVSRTLEENATQLVHRWQYIADKIDDRLSMRIFLKSIRSATLENRTIIASFESMFVGPVKQLLPIMEAEFPELGLREEDCSEMRWIESILYFENLQSQPLDVLLDRNAQRNEYFKGKSDFVTHPIPVNGLRGIWELLNQEDEHAGEIQFSPHGGRLNDVSESETPFPHRSGTIFMIHYQLVWFQQEDGNSHLSWLRRLYSYMTPYVSKSPRCAYINYRDLDIGKNNPSAGNTSYSQASVWGFKYFKNNFNRLVRVKTKVDPSDFFRNEQSVPPLPTIS